MRFDTEQYLQCLVVIPELVVLVIAGVMSVRDIWRRRQKGEKKLGLSTKIIATGAILAVTLGTAGRVRLSAIHHAQTVAAYHSIRSQHYNFAWLNTSNGTVTIKPAHCGEIDFRLRHNGSDYWPTLPHTTNRLSRSDVDRIINGC